MVRKIIDVCIIIGLCIGAYYIVAIFWGDTPLAENWTFRKEPKAVGSYEDMRERERISAERDASIYNEALKSHDFALCDTLSDTREKSRCSDMIGASLALKSGKKEQCDTIKSSDVKERCRDNIAFSQAELSLSRDICETISDKNLSIQCYNSVDTTNLSLRTSSGIVDSVFCETLGGEVRGQCQARIDHSNNNNSYRLALSTKILTDCENITDTPLKTKCRDTILFDQAIREKNSILCESITDTPRMLYCQKSIEVRSDADLYKTII